MNDQRNCQTAYTFNNHASLQTPSNKNYGWNNQINRMLEQRYAFLALEYETSGYLFRGMSSGFTSALLEQQFWHFNSDDSVACFEQELDVIFASQDLSDALTVARLWEDNIDAGILVFRSTVFNQSLLDKRAAMLATAEPGVVFKYPFLTRPLELEDIAYLVMPSVIFQNEDEALSPLLDKLDDQGRLICIDDADVTLSRAEYENQLLDEFEKKSIIASRTMPSQYKPAISNK